MNRKPRTDLTGIDHNITEQLLYGKQHSVIISGVAILLMLFHHFFGFQIWLKQDVTCSSILSPVLMSNLARFSKMCVAIFAFNTGYAMWSKQDSYAYAKIPSRICNFLLKYWVVCALFILYAIIVNDKLPTFGQFAYNLFGLATSRSEFVNCGFSWYVHFYIIILILSPIILRVFQCKGLVLNFLIIVALVFCAQQFRNLDINAISASLAEYLGCVLMGVYVCKFSLFQVIDNFVKRRNIVFYVGMILILIVIRRYVVIPYIGYIKDAIIVVFLIYSILSILRDLKSNRINNALSLLGKYSMNMWFVHAIFFTGTLNILQRVLYFPEYSLLVFIWGIILTLPVAMSCSYLQNIILRLLKFN